MYIRDLQNKISRFRRRIDPEIIEQEIRRERKKGIVKGFAIGSIVAGITALFLSPDSGKNNRKRAKEELEKAKELLEINIGQSKDKLSEIYEKTKQTIHNKKETTGEQFDFSDDINDINTIEDFEETENGDIDSEY